MTGYPGVKIVTWTDNEIAILRKLTDEGLSASKIGLRLGQTRNSIIGRWKRERDKHE